jgi:uncharacterized SAM-binding protein YcdF (DUF218 family)
MLVLKQLVSTLILPPALPLLGAGLGLLMMRGKHRRKGWLLVALMLALLWLLSCEVGVRMAYRAIESEQAVWTTQRYEKTPAQAIVILGGGGQRGAAEYGGASINARSAMRLMYGLRLAKTTGLPALYSGGNADPGTGADGQFSEAQAAQQMAKNMFGTELRWLETRSRDTKENASYTALLLQPPPLQIKRIVLVTHAWHMTRAQRYFERAGFEVQPAPMGFIGASDSTPREWLPSADGMMMSWQLWREQLGLWVQAWQ